ncbi:autolysin, partial [Staphylococcus agnetis]
MRKHKQGSLISVIVLLIVAAIAGFLFFSMIKDQIFFKSVKQVER